MGCVCSLQRLGLFQLKEGREERRREEEEEGRWRGEGRRSSGRYPPPR
jgi:hypothetical protein